MKFTLDFGQTWDLLTPGEMQSILAEQDTANRAIYAGVKTVEQFFNINQIGAAQTIYSTPAGMVPSGFVWAIMNIGMELSAASSVRVYKGIPQSGTAAPTGLGRVAGVLTNFVTPNGQFSKGQLMLRAGDQLTFFPPTGPPNILSVFIVAIEVPAERIGELLL